MGFGTPSPSPNSPRERFGNLFQAQADEYREQAATSSERDVIASTLAGVGEYLFDWVPARHHRIWCDAIERLFNREIPSNRLLVIAPPAHAKTNWAGVAAPAYYVGTRPQDHILYLSSAQGQALKPSIAVRDTIAINKRWGQLFPDVKPDRLKGWAGHRWFVERPDHPGDKDPTMLSAGVGSQMVLGARADFILFDDIVTQENVATAYRRDKVKAWVSQTAFSREARDAVMMGIMTRWHSDDIARFFQEEAEFEVIVMPALGYWDEELGVDMPLEERTPLWEEELDRKFLLRKIIDLGPIKFSGMYQGNPVPEGGALFQDEFWQPYFIPFCNPIAQETLARSNRALKPPYNAVVVAKQDADTGEVVGESVPLTQQILTVDTAFKEAPASERGSAPDYTVMALWGIGIDRQAYLLDVWRRQIDANKLYNTLIRYWRKWRPDWAVIEDRASGIQLIQDLQLKQNIPVTGVSPLQNKEERAKGQLHVIEGAFHVPNPDLYYEERPDGTKKYYEDWRPESGDPLPGEWITEFMREHNEFPMGRNDDQVDTTTQFAEVARHLLNWWTPEAEDQTQHLVEAARLMRPNPLPGRGGGDESFAAGTGGAALTGFGVPRGGGGGNMDWPGR